MVILEVVVLYGGVSGTPWEAAPSWPWKALRRDLYTDVQPREEYIVEILKDKQELLKSLSTLVEGSRSKGSSFIRNFRLPNSLGK